MGPSYSRAPYLDVASLPAGSGVVNGHVYAYGVLAELLRVLGLGSLDTGGSVNATLRELLRPDAPRFEDYPVPDEWRGAAVDGGIRGLFYGFDWIDPERWDCWLYDHYQSYRESMRSEIMSRLTGLASWSGACGIPVVVGEGWVGYTPLRGGFEEGPAGQDLAELGVRTALEAGFWGLTPCSNAAPHHPMWADVDWQRKMNALVRDQ
jgi:hypothetical protein